MIPDDLVWTEPGRDSRDSMPLGNGDIGLNAWVEAGGDLLLYLSKTDAWDENGRLIKLGRLRVRLEPNPFGEGSPFVQTLVLHEGLIRIEAGQAPAAVDMRIWVDANRPVVHVQAQARFPLEVRAGLEIWRTARRPLTGQEQHAPIGGRSEEECAEVFPDLVIADAPPEAVIWCHRNEQSVWGQTLEHQDLAGWMAQGSDPLLHRTFGALMRGDGLVRRGDRTLASETPLRQFDLTVHPLTARTTTLAGWVDQVTAGAEQCRRVPADEAFGRHRAWWQGFWDRSWVNVRGDDQAQAVTRGYAMQRFLNACAGRGACPIKFNGSIFTFDARQPGEDFDADYRRWGGGYWFQNTRLIYWSMLASGDIDLVQPWLRMYLDALPLAQCRTRRYFGHDGAMFPETMTFWGSYLNGNYGYDRHGRKPGQVQNTYIRRYWQGMLELVAFMLDLYALTQDEDFAREVLLPLAREFIAFYQGAFPARAADGTVLFAPSQALETWHEAANPLPEIAGLRWVLDGLLGLPRGLVADELRQSWADYRRQLPPLPQRTCAWGNTTELIPAMQYDHCANTENPALYAVFPYRLYGVGKPDIDVGLATWEARPVKATGCWRQDAIQAAMLGLADDAWRDVAANFCTPSAGRFPAFWGPNNDWIPDVDHGAVAMIAIQRMLMQCEQERILLLPAWPRQRDVRFRLHAPQRTVVEASYRGGRIERLSVSPSRRSADVVLPQWLPGR